MARVIQSNHHNYTSVVDRFRKIEPLTPWEDINEGEYYHIAPVLSYDRRDFRVTSKNNNMLVGILKEEGEKPRQYSFYKQEVSTRYLVKTMPINGKRYDLF